MMQGRHRLLLWLVVSSLAYWRAAGDDVHWQSAESGDGERKTVYATTSTQVVPAAAHGPSDRRTRTSAHLVLATTADGHVHALDPADGAVLYTVATQGPLARVFQTRQAGEEAGGAIVPSLGGDLLVADTEAGILERYGMSIQEIVDATAKQPLMGGASSFLLGARRTSILAVDLATGTVLCELALSPSGLGPGGVGPGRCDAAQHSGDAVLWLARTAHDVGAVRAAGGSPGDSAFGDQLWNASVVDLRPVHVGGGSDLAGAYAFAAAQAAQWSGAPGRAYSGGTGDTPCTFRASPDGVLSCVSAFTGFEHWHQTLGAAVASVHTVFGPEGHEVATALHEDGSDAATEESIRTGANRRNRSSGESAKPSQGRESGTAGEGGTQDADAVAAPLKGMHVPRWVQSENLTLHFGGAHQGAVLAASSVSDEAGHVEGQGDESVAVLHDGGDSSLFASLGTVWKEPSDPLHSDQGGTATASRRAQSTAVARVKSWLSRWPKMAQRALPTPLPSDGAHKDGNAGEGEGEGEDPPHTSHHVSAVCLADALRVWAEEARAAQCSREGGEETHGRTAAFPAEGTPTPSSPSDGSVALVGQYVSVAGGVRHVWSGPFAVAGGGAATAASRGPLAPLWAPATNDRSAGGWGPVAPPSAAIGALSGPIAPRAPPFLPEPPAPPGSVGQAVLWGGALLLAMIAIGGAGALLGRVRWSAAPAPAPGVDKAGEPAEEGDDQTGEAATSLVSVGGGLRLHRQVLGYGCHGTTVLAGTLHGRPVAVKRMLCDFYRAADREMELLLAADGHPNVVRYFARVQRDHFVYLALERCACSLRDLCMGRTVAVEDVSASTPRPEEEPSSASSPATAALPAVSEWPLRIQTELLRGVALGVAHLHSQRIVHRDLKPANVLLALAPPPRAHTRRKAGAKGADAPGSSSGGGDDPCDDDSGSSDTALLRRVVPKISDMGLGKQLADHVSSFGSSVVPLSPAIPAVGLAAPTGSASSSSSGQRAPGSIGWQAPELLLRAHALGHGNEEAAETDESSGSSRSERYRSGDAGSGPSPSTSSASGRGDRPSSAAGGPARPSRRVDIFSMGCLFHHTASGGGHPFGPPLERERNVVAGRTDFGALASRPLLRHLVACMTRAEPRRRPRAAQVLAHPVFWGPDQRLQLVQDVSDCMEQQAATTECALALEARAGTVVGDNWGNTLHTSLVKHATQFRSYRFNRVADLLRVLRNKRHHVNELPQDIRRRLQPSQRFLAYFEHRFPNLILACYQLACAFFRDSDAFSGFNLWPWQVCDASAACADTQLVQPPHACTPDSEAAGGAACSAEAAGETARQWAPPLSQWAAMVPSRPDNLPPPPYQLDWRYKTQLCRDYSTSRGESCPRGSRCDFAHTPVELRLRGWKGRKGPSNGAGAEARPNGPAQESASSASRSDARRRKPRRGRPAASGSTRGGHSSAAPK